MTEVKCPACAEIGLDCNLQLYQINLTKAVYLCKTKSCTYPKGFAWKYVDRSCYDQLLESDDDDDTSSDSDYEIFFKNYMTNKTKTPTKKLITTDCISKSSNCKTNLNLSYTSPPSLLSNNKKNDKDIDLRSLGITKIETSGDALDKSLNIIEGNLNLETNTSLLDISIQPMNDSFGSVSSELINIYTANDTLNHSLPVFDDLFISPLKKCNDLKDNGEKPVCNLVSDNETNNSDNQMESCISDSKNSINISNSSLENDAINNKDIDISYKDVTQNLACSTVTSLENMSDFSISNSLETIDINNTVSENSIKPNINQITNKTENDTKTITTEQTVASSSSVIDLTSHLTLKIVNDNVKNDEELQTSKINIEDSSNKSLTPKQNSCLSSPLANLHSVSKLTPEKNSDKTDQNDKESHDINLSSNDIQKVEKKADDIDVNMKITKNLQSHLQSQVNFDIKVSLLNGDSVPDENVKLSPCDKPDSPNKTKQVVIDLSKSQGPMLNQKPLKIISIKGKNACPENILKTVNSLMNKSGKPVKVCVLKNNKINSVLSNGTGFKIDRSKKQVISTSLLSSALQMTKQVVTKKEVPNKNIPVKKVNKIVPNNFDWVRKVEVIKGSGNTPQFKSKKNKFEGFSFHSEVIKKANEEVDVSQNCINKAEVQNEALNHEADLIDLLENIDNVNLKETQTPETDEWLTSLLNN